MSVRLVTAIAATVIAAAVMATASVAHATARDYDPGNPEWNGLSELAQLAAQLNLPIEVTDHLDWNTLDPEHDVLLVLYPRDPLDGNALTAWIEAGGNALIADDFGRADSALAMLGVDRMPARGVAPKRFYEDNVALPVASAWVTSHPLARGVTELMTNHPAIFGGPSADPADGAIFGFGAHQALVIAAQRGEGRFIALADPSVLINEMLAFGGNLSFAANVLRWLTPDRGARRVVLITSDFVVTGTPPASARSELGLPKIAMAIAEVSHGLREADLWVPEEPPLRGLAVALGAALVLALMWRLPLLRKPAHVEDASWLGSAHTTYASDASAAVAAVDVVDGSGDFTMAAALLREHVEALLSRVTGVAEPFNLVPAELARLVRHRGGPAAATALAQLESAGVRALPSRTAVPRWRSVTRRDAQADFDRVYDAARRLDVALADPSREPS